MAEALASARSLAESKRMGSRKRRYDPGIAAYFHPQSSADALDSIPSLPKPQAAADDIAAKPSLPSGVQASLLNVGMRVRKAVGEGYHLLSKTGAAPSRPGFELYSTEDKNNRNKASVAHSQYKASELMPFCGMHKVGDYDRGVSSNHHAYTDDDFSVFSPFDIPSSQDSIMSDSSTDSMPANARKRGFDASEEDDQENNNGFLPDGRELVLTERSVFSDNSQQGLRPIARATGRLKQRKGKAPSYGNEIAVPDFEDAQFLYGYS